MFSLLGLSPSVLAVFLILALQPGRAAETSLYIPGFDPQPISADILGVDSQGRTTWALHQGAPTGTDQDAGGFAGQTATLVAGSDSVFLTMVHTVDVPKPVTFGYACALNSDQALCSGEYQEASSTVTVIDTVSPIAVQIGTTATGVSTPQSQSSSQPAPSTGASNPSTPSATGTPRNAAASSFRFPAGRYGIALVMLWMGNRL